MNTTTEWQLKGAAAKLAYIQSHITNPDKTGRNDFHKFDYVQEHGIIELLRPLLRELHCSVVSSPAAIEVRVDDGQTGKGKAQKLVTLVGELTFTDTDEPADSLDRSIVARFTGAGADDLDKAHAKAQTIFTKYALQKFFLIPTEKIEDGDATPAPEPAAKPAAQTGGTAKADSAPAPTTGGADSPAPSPADTIPASHVSALRTLATNTGRSADWLSWALVAVGATVDESITDVGERIRSAIEGLSLEQAVLLAESMGGKPEDLA